MNYKLWAINHLIEGGFDKYPSVENMVFAKKELKKNFKKKSFYERWVLRKRHKTLIELIDWFIEYFNSYPENVRNEKIKIHLKVIVQTMKKDFEKRAKQ